MSTVQAENLRAVQNIYDAFARGDAETAASFFSSNIVLHEPESLPYGGTYIGLEEIAGAVGEIAQRLDLSGLHVEKLIGDSETVVALVRGTWRGDNGRNVEVRLSEWFTFADGKVVELRAFYWDSGALNETLD